MLKFKFLRRLKRHPDDERGAVLVLTGMCMILILGAGALGVDVGFTVYGSRSAQAMADTAALDLAQDIPTIDAEPSNAAVTSYITAQLAGVDTDNGSNAVLTGTPGVWYNGTFSTLAGGCAGTTFLTPPLACNAIQVTATQTVPQPFWGGFNHGTSRTTIAAWQPKAGLSIGSYLVSINTQQSAVLNKILGKKLASSAAVTALGYQGLANTYLKLSDLITASGGVLTDSNVLTTSLSGQQWLTIFGAAVGNQVAQLNCGSSPTPPPCNASTGLSALNFSASYSAELCQMVSVNGSTCQNGSLSTSALGADVNLLQTLTTEAELANGTNAVDVTSALSLPGVTQANLSLNLIQPPGTGGPGPVGSYTTASPCPAPSGQTSTCAYDAQLSSDLSLTVLGILGQSINVDIPLSGATGYATLSSITCSTSQVFQNLKINVSTTAASGTVTENGTSLSTLTINGKSGSGNFTTVPPSASSVSLGTNPRTFSNSPTLSYSPALTLVPGLDANVLTLLNSTLVAVLGPVLQVTGASVGGAQVAATSVSCPVVSLAQ